MYKQKENKMTIIRSYTLGEEIGSSISHGLGVFLGIAGLSVLVALSAIYANAWAVVGSAIFGGSWILMYTASTCYHAIPFEHAKSLLKKFDHISIYYLIAGTYTPLILSQLRTPAGWTVLGVVWGTAFLGTILKLWIGGSGAKLWSVSLYLAMGWAVLFVLKDVVERLNSVALTFLVLGGLFYTLGIFFYLWKSKSYTHFIWHCFVLTGTIMHFFAVLFGCIFTNI